MIFGKFTKKIKEFFKAEDINEEFFDSLEDLLIEGDMGASLTDRLVTELRRAAKEGKVRDTFSLQILMKEILSKEIESAKLVPVRGELSLYLFLGVNGVGKTTTVAKAALYYKNLGYKTLIAAADTFRAAAVEQLSLHAERTGVRIVKQERGSDAAAVIFDSISSALSQGDDLILADTAGRMHNKENLMKEIMKIDKIIKTREIKEENYKKFLVLDATTGQNAVQQAEMFNERVKIDALILTKYDSEAKGGTLFQISKNLNLPVAFLCTGERYADIEVFDKEAFLETMVGIK